MYAGLSGSVKRGFEIWDSTMPSIVSLSIPLSRAAWNAASRSGPTSAVVGASLNAWQVPHFSTNRVRPFSVSAVSCRSHPGSTTSAAVAAAAMRTPVSLLREALTGRQILSSGGHGDRRVSARCRFDRVEPIVTNRGV
jgi:hypothetical protein